jgi:hypothetical protein
VPKGQILITMILPFTNKKSRSRKKIKVAPWWAVDILVAGLVHRGEQVEEGIPGGVESHGVFYFYEIATAVDGFGFNNDKRMW